MGAGRAATVDIREEFERQPRSGMRILARVRPRRHPIRDETSCAADES